MIVNNLQEQEDYENTKINLVDKERQLFIFKENLRAQKEFNN